MLHARRLRLGASTYDGNLSVLQVYGVLVVRILRQVHKKAFAAVDKPQAQPQA
jgi:hypothetical protein